MVSEIKHILVVDDDTRIRDLLSKFLQDKGYFVSVAQDAKEARRQLELFSFDLLILDVMMPGESGVELTRYIRQSSDVPILMLTAMGDVEDRISGLKSGADDYLPKPFEPMELLLRIERVLERVYKQKRSLEVVRFGQLEFNSRTGDLTDSGEVVALTSNEAKLLKLLSQSLGKPISREQLAQECGGVNERTVDVQITRLRNKLEQDPKQPLFLKTIRGQGYVLYGG
jgi:two-component system phosphate regulon response regulator OmpR